jgi:hypothetical protein
MLIISPGKKASSGTIMLYCLNLPPHLRYRPENTFIIGITPAPHAPNPTTISHLLDPIVESLAKYNISFSVPTFGYPTGIPITVKAVPLIADLEANNKVSGFLAHAAIMYCSFCLSTQDQIEDLDIQSWQMRNGQTVRDQAMEWRNSTTKTARTAKEKSTGVRWTSLHSLPYWDPVNHTVLGFLHNWVEGVLKNHLRTLWGIGRDEKEEQKLKDLELEEQLTNTDVSDSASELEELHQEAAEHSAHWHIPSMPEGMLPPDSPTPSVTTLDSSSSTTPTQPLSPDMDVDDHYDPDFIPPLSLDTPPFDFSESQLLSIRDCIQNITIPTWVQRPPVNLGDPSHGKLKAHEYLTLFTSIFPLIIPELWYGPNTSRTDQEHLQCFHHLVSATNIIASFTASFKKADDYMYHYISYRALIQRLYPHFPSKPNHHYAMHNGDLMKWWGPLPCLSEFFGERVNGMLQSTNTNQRLSRSLLQH